MSPYLSEILKLSVPERILLVEAIWDSIASENSKDNRYKLNEEQIQILEDELQAYSRNPDEGSSWEEIKRESPHRNEFPDSHPNAGRKSYYRSV